MICCFFILSAAVVTVQSSIIRKAPSAPVLFQFSSTDDESSSPSTISSECREAATIRETLEQTFLNFRNCEDGTPSQDCVVGIPKAIAVCYKELAIASDCVQEMFDVSQDIRSVVVKGNSFF